MSTFGNIVMKIQLCENEMQTLNLNSYKKHYESGTMLSECEDVILEAKRVLINEDVEKIQTYTSLCPKKYAKLLDWKNEAFWKNLPNPKNNASIKNINTPNIESITKQYVDSIFGDLLQKNADDKSQIVSINDRPNYRNNFLSEKYFNIWKNTVESRKEQNKQTENETKQKTKLEEFMKKLKKRKKSEKPKKVHIEDNGDGIEAVELSPIKTNSKSGSSNYKHRFDAQKTIIQMQKAKLEEQHKIIEELKLGIISDDLLRSVENTKTDIREIFQNCSEKIKYKIPILLGDESRFFVSSQKAPKVVQRMECRAREREHNRQVILERKRIIEEARHKMLQEAIEKKRVLEEEEKKKSLELIKERRRKEMEMEKIRLANKQKYMEKLNRAVEFHNDLLKKQYLRKLYENMKKQREHYFLAIEHYERKIFNKCINDWQLFVEDAYKLKYEMADAHLEYKTLKKCMKGWRKVHIESIRNMQVAEDFYDFRLTSNIFRHWNNYVCVQFMKEHKNMKKSEQHHKRWLLFHYFYLWRSLKVVNELEKAKELKKAKWRQKVWEILPDYKPPEDV